jgi:uncharacterized protein
LIAEETGIIMTKTFFSFITLIFIVVVTGRTQDISELKLKDYRPESIYRIPVTFITKAKFPAIDMHSHDFARNDEEVAQWVKTMDEKGIQKTIILSGATGDQFDKVHRKYARYHDRFEVWCGFYIDGYEHAGWIEKALKELERCYRMGARGVGELSDKGLGLRYSGGYGPHFNDPILKPLIKRCGELKMPINIHVAEPYWMYLPMDSTNDGLMNAHKWRVDLTKEGILGHGQLIQTLEETIRESRGTTFIACHYANCEYDLSILGQLFDKYPNLYADASARFGETSAIPRYMAAFYEKYQDRLLYGTDNLPEDLMYETTFRILETGDEHFYYYRFYHWPSHGWDLEDSILEKVYQKNPRKILMK